jgi:apolipoprotein D and lipocalin family protein
MNRSGQTMTKKIHLRALLCFLLASALQGCQSGPPLEVAPSVSISQLQGKWYEIARLPRTTEVDCHGTTAFYTQAADGSLSLVNQCNVGSATGPLQTIAMTATVPDSSVPAKLALDVGGYTGDYWVLEVGTNYEYVVVGHPSRLYLWILSRTPTLDSDVMSGILARAKAKSFDTQALEYTPQPPAGERATSDTPEGDVPPSPRTGCSGSSIATLSSSSAASAWGLLAMAAVVVALRRRQQPSG